MLRKQCRDFRMHYDPAGPRGHEEACARCARWAEAAADLRRAGPDLPLPDPLVAVLRGIPHLPAHAREVYLPGPLPQIPLPPALRVSLTRIPGRPREGARAGRPPLRTGETVAASLVLAALVTLSLGNRIRWGREPLPPVVAWAAKAGAGFLTNAGSRGTDSILDAGATLLRGCAAADQTLQRAMEKLAVSEPAPPRPDSPTPDGGKPPARPGPLDPKENSHGKRPNR